MVLDNISSPQERVALFVREAPDAAQLACSLCESISAPNEVKKVIEDTLRIAEDAAAANYSQNALNSLNWEMHVACAGLYLNVQRIPRKGREKLSPIVTAYKNMMFHFSMGQMQLHPIPLEQSMSDIVKHANILNDTAQEELTRLSGFFEMSLHELAGRVSEITVQQVKTGMHHSLPARFLYIAHELRQAADTMGETADTLCHLADEYGFLR